MEGTRLRHVPRCRKSKFHMMIRYYNKTWQKGRMGLGYKVFSQGNLRCTFVDSGDFRISNDRHKNQISQGMNAFVWILFVYLLPFKNSSVLHLIKTLRIIRYTFIEKYVVLPSYMACLRNRGSSAVSDFRHPRCIRIGSASKFRDEGKRLIHFLMYMYLNWQAVCLASILNHILGSVWFEFSNRVCFNDS